MKNEYVSCMVQLAITVTTVSVYIALGGYNSHSNCDS